MTLASTFRMFAALLLALFAATQPVQAERIKDLGAFQGLRANQQVG